MNKLLPDYKNPVWMHSTGSWTDFVSPHLRSNWSNLPGWLQYEIAYSLSSCIETCLETSKAVEQEAIESAIVKHETSKEYFNG